MRQHTFLLAIAMLLPSLVQAEARGIAIEISYRMSAAGTSVAEVTIHSRIGSERRKNVSVAEAASVIKKATGQGFGQVMVLVVLRDRVDLMSYIALLDAIAKNAMFDLWAVRRSEDRYVTRNILEQYKIKLPPQRHVPKPMPAK